MKAQTSQTLYLYWNQIRGDRLAPRRFEIEPSEIAPILPDTFILERLPDRSYSYRIAGTRICEAFGCEFRGQDFAASWPAPDRKTINALLNGPLQDGAVGIIEFESETDDGQSLDWELLMLPLVHLGEGIDRVLGSFSTLTNPPCLASRPLARRRIRSFRHIWPDGRPYAFLGGGGGGQSPFLTRPGYSRVVTSDRRCFRVYEGGLGKT